MTAEHRVCTRCVMDTTIPDIRFDQGGECNFCKIHDRLEEMYPQGEAGQRILEQTVAQIKASGQGKDFDCVAGVSGGRDSTYTLYVAAKLGLRPLAVHFDNGWDSEIAVTNIQRAVQKLDLDLETIVVDWEEFRELQKAFLRASVPDVEVPTDVAIHAVLHKVAAKEGLKWVINGHSFRTEGVAPLSWTYMDGRYIRAINKRFGTRPLVTFPNFTLRDYVDITLRKGVKVFPLLNFVEYDHAEAQAVMERELGWQYYGGHHYESYYTKFIQAHMLPAKFNLDKRKTEYSALVRSGQLTRDQALAKLEEPIWEHDEDLIDYTLTKLHLSRGEYEAIMAAKPKSFRDYPTYYPLILAMKPAIKTAVKLGLVHELIYMKFFP